MGIPFEVRAPFLDYRLVEYACRLPTSYLVRDGWHKWILRTALRGFLPPDVLWRRQKMGFPFPYDRFLCESKPILSLIFNRAHNPYLDLARSHGLRHDWRVVSFILWYELFFNQNMPLFSEIAEMGRRLSYPTESGHWPEFWESSDVLTSWA
jgi:asparagine synthase (glutamine-hydrolysing)